MGRAFIRTVGAVSCVHRLRTWPKIAHYAHRMVSQALLSERGVLTRSRAENARNPLLVGSAGSAGADEDDFHALQRRKESMTREEKREEKVAKVGPLHVRKKPKVVQF